MTVVLQRDRGSRGNANCEERSEHNRGNQLSSGREQRRK
jgi:hypothetical protein